MGIHNVVARPESMYDSPGFTDDLWELHGSTSRLGEQQGCSPFRPSPHSSHKHELTKRTSTANHNGYSKEFEETHTRRQDLSTTNWKGTQRDIPTRGRPQYVGRGCLRKYPQAAPVERLIIKQWQRDSGNGMYLSPQ